MPKIDIPNIRRFQQQVQQSQINQINQNNPYLNIQQNPYLQENQQAIHPAFPDPYKEQQQLQEMRERQELNTLQEMQPFQVQEKELKKQREKRMIDKKRLQEKVMKERQKQELIKQFKKEMKKQPKFSEEEKSAMKILKLKPNYTIEQLKMEFRKLALQTHPDKGGNEQLFFIATKAYKTLLKSVKKRTRQNNFLDLKNNFLEFKDTQRPTKLVELEEDDEKAKQQKSQNDYFERKRKLFTGDDSRGFNLNRFNQIYQDNKLEDDNEDGYERWMVENQPEETTDNPRLFKKYNKRHFHNRFEKEKDEKQGTQIIKYEDPKPMSISNKLKFVELGGKKPKDFSNSTNINHTGHIKFTDYKQAHSSLLINPKVAKQREKFKNVQDLEAKREKISYKMNEKDKIYYEKKKKLELMHEEDRIRRLEERDIKIKHHFDKVNKLMLGNM